MTVAAEIFNKIKEYQTIIIHRHQNADPDALGSQGGLAEIIRDNFPDKKVVTVGKDTLGLKWLLQADEVLDELYQDALVIVTDTANTPRIDDERYLKGKYLIKIDHHPDDDPYGDLSLVNPEASSCSEIIFDLAQANQLKISQKAASLLYTGIVGDTGRFMYDCTTPHTLKVAAQLMQTGIDCTKINRKIDEISLAEAKLAAYAYQNLKLTEHKAAYLVVNRQIMTELGVNNTAKIVSLPGKISEVLCWALIVEQEDGSYRLRLRSKQPVINELAKEYDGGGHPLASGAKLPSAVGIEQFVTKLDQVAAKFMEEN